MNSLKTFLLCVSSAMFAAVACAAGADTPNVLMIVIDDLRPELGCYGADYVKSPNIDRLSRSGLLFERAYCQQAVCNPSRTSLMTGLRPEAIGVTANHVHFRDKHPNVVTLSQHFKDHGYRAQSIGKVFHGVFPDGASKTKWDTMGDPLSWSIPTTRFGPRYYYTENGMRQAKQAFLKMYKPVDPGPDDWTEKLVFGPITESPDVEDHVLYDGKVADAAVAALDALSRQAGQPFFLAVGFIKPHTPFVAPKKYFDMYSADDIELAPNAEFPDGAPGFAGHGSGEIRRYTDQPNHGPISEENRRRMLHAYRACTSFTDAQVGKVLDALQRFGLDDNSIVVLFGDHGYHLGEKGLWGKTTNFELDARVPLIVRAPAMKAAGQRTGALTELVDLYPTLVELAELPATQPLDGTSFARTLDDPQYASDAAAFTQYPRGGNADLGGQMMGYSIRTNCWRYTEWVKRETGEVVAQELYDHRDNDAETVNVASRREHRELIAQLSQRLAESGVTGNREHQIPHDLELAAQNVLEIERAEADQPMLPALIGNPATAIARLTIHVATGPGVPPAIETIRVNTAGTSDLSDIEQVELFYTGAEPALDVRRLSDVAKFGESQPPANVLEFAGRQSLVSGANHFWVSMRLRPSANLDGQVDAEFEGYSVVGTAMQEPLQQTADAAQRIGVAVRRSGDDGAHTYRIPGLATTNQGTLIAVYDIRRRGGGDLPGDIDVGMSRSTDGGATWEPMQVIMDMGDDPRWRYDGIGDPSVLVDRDANAVWVAATWSHGNRSWVGSGPGMTPEQTGQFMLVRSDDDGQTWSQPINITEQVKRPEWCFFASRAREGIDNA